MPSQALKNCRMKAKRREKRLFHPFRGKSFLFNTIFKQNLFNAQKGTKYQRNVGFSQQIDTPSKFCKNLSNTLKSGYK
jgi:hypothetical protein